jgi:hypothetical protein
MVSRERWLFCRLCKSWHTVPCSRTSSKFLMLSILGSLLQTRPINAAEMQGKGDYSIADSCFLPNPTLRCCASGRGRLLLLPPP